MKKPTVHSQIGTAAKLLTYAMNVLQKSLENADLFPEATDTLVELETALEAYRTGLSEAAFGDRREVVLKNQHALKLKQVLQRYALYIEAIAQGDADIILAAGFIPSKNSRTSIGPSPKPHNLRAEIYMAGTCSIRLRVEHWRPARYYQYEYRIVDSGKEWTKILETKSKVIIHDLEKLQEYEFRVTYLGSDPSPNYSEIVRCFAV